MLSCTQSPPGKLSEESAISDILSAEVYPTAKGILMGFEPSKDWENGGKMFNNVMSWG